MKYGHIEFRAQIKRKNANKQECATSAIFAVD
jgi:hypothetical protein